MRYRLQRILVLSHNRAWQLTMESPQHDKVGTPTSNAPAEQISTSGTLVRGVLMGCADSVPGISGGTVALVCGIYERLVQSISRFNRQLLTMLWSRQWRQSARHVDLGFLLTLIAGILVGLLATTTLAHQLLSNASSRPVTLACLLGMMLACTWLVLRRLQARHRQQLARMLIAGISAGVLAWMITEQPHSSLSPSHAWLFISGMVGISAMILPGLSGAMILMIMGVYLKLTAIPRSLMEGGQRTDDLVVVAVFAAGCVTGLMLFSRLLRFLLSQFPQVTMATLCGAMAGSLRALWPFQEEIVGSGSEASGKVVYRLFWPAPFGSEHLWTLLAGGVSMAAILWIASRATAHKKTLQDEPAG